jgi:hypothetical protein
MDVCRESPTPEHPDDELALLRRELTRLRELVGPSEKSYEGLAQDASSARDAARRAELETGHLRARIVELENEVRRWRRDFVWFRDRVVQKVPIVGRVFACVRRK